MAIYNGVILDVRFPHVVYKKLMSDVLTLADLKKAFPDIGNSLQLLLDFEPASQVEETFGLCMQVTFEEFGQKLAHDLVAGGGEVPVTQHNRGEYVRRYTEYLLAGSVARQFEAFLRGFHSVCGGECLRLFRWEELELLICGSPDLDFEVRSPGPRRPRLSLPEQCPMHMCARPHLLPIINPWRPLAGAGACRAVRRRLFSGPPIDYATVGSHPRAAGGAQEEVPLLLDRLGQGPDQGPGEPQLCHLSQRGG